MGRENLENFDDFIEDDGEDLEVDSETPDASEAEENKQEQTQADNVQADNAKEKEDSGTKTEKPEFHWSNYIISAKDLMAREFPPIKWAVNGLIGEGTTLLVGAPKAGKSKFALDIALAIATGGHALGKIPVEQGDCLYLDMENGTRRIKQRLEQRLNAAPIPEKLRFSDDNIPFPKIGEGAIEALESWLDDFPETRLIIIDTLKRVRPNEKGVRGIYDVDYDAVAPLTDLAHRYGVAIVIVHHDTKAKSVDDFIDNVSGSKGLTGAVDSIMMLENIQNQTARLQFKGRDLEHKILSLKNDSVINGWQLLGEAISEYAMKILEIFVAAGEIGLSKSELNGKLNGHIDGLGNALAELQTNGFLDLKGNRGERSKVTSHGIDYYQRSQASSTEIDNGLPF